MVSARSPAHILPGSKKSEMEPLRLDVLGQ